MKRLVPITFAACLVPLAWLVGRYLRNDLGANPIVELENRLGLYALVLLMSCLACTPLQLVFKLKWPLLVRKLLGNFAFFYACLHLSMYIGVDQFFDWADIGKDIVKRKFITIGMATWLLLLPLAITSTRGWQRRLQFRRWKRLHRLVYVAGIGAVIHFLWRFKTAVTQPLLFAAVLAILFAIRIVFVLRRRRIAATA